MDRTCWREVFLQPEQTTCPSTLSINLRTELLPVLGAEEATGPRGKVTSKGPPGSSGHPSRVTPRPTVLGGTHGKCLKEARLLTVSCPVFTEAVPSLSRAAVDVTRCGTTYMII